MDSLISFSCIVFTNQLHQTTYFLHPFEGFVNKIYIDNFNNGIKVFLSVKLKHLLYVLNTPLKTPYVCLHPSIN